uniref:Uncharacterized protein n=1 Tax=Quercus lobata TaxID=97700 RepID=A0A7N2LUK4_QUELO
MEGKLGVLDKSDWQPIKNIKDHFIQSIGAVSVFQYNKRSGSLLSMMESLSFQLDEFLSSHLDSELNI